MRAKRELLKIEGRTVEIILRANPRARRFIVLKSYSLHLAVHFVCV